MALESSTLGPQDLIQRCPQALTFLLKLRIEPPSLPPVRRENFESIRSVLALASQNFSSLYTSLAARFLELDPRKYWKGMRTLTNP